MGYRNLSYPPEFRSETVQLAKVSGRSVAATARVLVRDS
jgi:transposase-like protein